MRNKLFIFILAITVIFPSFIFAEYDKNTVNVRNDVRIGDVTVITGNVLARTNGKWSSTRSSNGSKACCKLSWNG